MLTASQHVVIIGNGVAGITAARHIRKRSDARITVISGETEYFYSRTALMYIYMGHMRFEHTKPYEDAFWQKNRIDLCFDWVKQIAPQLKQVVLASGRSILYDRLLIATGSQPRQLACPGIGLDGVQSLYSVQELQRMETSTREIQSAAVVGGGLIGVEMAEMLHSKNIHTTFLVRESSWMPHMFPDEESQMVSRHMRSHGIDLRLGCELESIQGEASGRVKSIQTQCGQTIPCEFVGVTIGVRPNVELAARCGLDTERGILIDNHCRTNMPDIFAAGDCAQLRETCVRRRSIEPIWYVARRMGEVAAANLCGDDVRYEQGVWFNSAKFFDIEYQVYGDVYPELPAGVESLYYEPPNGNQSIRLAYEAPDGPVRGFLLMGIRYRQELCERWIKEKQSIRFVLQHLAAANFDPELHAQYESQLIELYNRKYPGMAVRATGRRGLRGVLTALRAAGQST